MPTTLFSLWHSFQIWLNWASFGFFPTFIWLFLHLIELYSRNWNFKMEICRCAQSKVCSLLCYQGRTVAHKGHGKLSFSGRKPFFRVLHFLSHSWHTIFHVHRTHCFISTSHIVSYSYTSHIVSYPRHTFSHMHREHSRTLFQITPHIVSYPPHTLFHIHGTFFHMHREHCFKSRHTLFHIHRTLSLTCIAHIRAHCFISTSHIVSYSHHGT